jgi:hypothetical protein
MLPAAKRTRASVIGSVVVAASLLLTASPASALHGTGTTSRSTGSSTTTTTAPQIADSVGINVSPPTSEIDGTPGGTVTKKITLTSSYPFPQDFNVSVKNFAASGESGEAEIVDDSPYAMSQWITVSPNKVTLAANASQDFNVTIKIPDNAPPGGHFGAVVFTPGPSNNNGNVKVTPEISSLLLLRLPGDATEKASIASFHSQSIKPGKTTGQDDRLAGAAVNAAANAITKNQTFFQKGPVNFEFRVKNDGNIQLKPQGTISIYNMFGSKIATIPVSAQNTLPGSVRKFDGEWKHPSLFGFYKAKLDVNYGSNGQKLHSETSFQGAPLMTVLLGIVILIALVLLVWLPRRRIKKAFKALAAG